MIPLRYRLVALREEFTRRLMNRVCWRSPDQIIGGEENPYLYRWHVLPRNRWFNIYLHNFVRSDDGRALHDHPWWNVSWILRGRYQEITPYDTSDPSGSCFLIHDREPGDVNFRMAKSAHRVRLHTRTDLRLPEPAWTLFVTGPRVREWGFWCPKGWRHWREFTDPDDSGSPR